LVRARSGCNEVQPQRSFAGSSERLFTEWHVNPIVKG
jgi:hypothetical protein